MVLMGLILVWGIALAAHGSPWLLVVGAILFFLAFVRIGCLGH
jgi:hypothetical protein